MTARTSARAAWVIGHADVAMGGTWDETLFWIWDNKRIKSAVFCNTRLLRMRFHWLSLSGEVIWNQASLLSYRYLDNGNLLETSATLSRVTWAVGYNESYKFELHVFCVSFLSNSYTALDRIQGLGTFDLAITFNRTCNSEWACHWIKSLRTAAFWASSCVRFASNWLTGRMQSRLQPAATCSVANAPQHSEPTRARSASRICTKAPHRSSSYR